MKKRRKQGLWLRRNLPLLIAAAALVLLILIIVLVAKGCSKTSDTTIQAEAFSTKTTIGLPVSAELQQRRLRLLRRLSVHHEKIAQRHEQARHQE